MLVDKMNLVMVLLSVAVNHGWECYQMDIKNSFLNGSLEKEVLVKTSLRFGEGSNKVCKLEKSLYGLK